MASIKEIMEKYQNEIHQYPNGVKTEVHYDLVRIDTLRGAVFIRADNFNMISPAHVPGKGNTMIITKDGQYLWTDEPQEQIAKRVVEARLFIVTPQEVSE
jgi:hypothetical protein